jgi:hypothetical protein
MHYTTWAYEPFPKTDNTFSLSPYFISERLWFKEIFEESLLDAEWTEELKELSRLEDVNDDRVEISSINLLF